MATDELAWFFDRLKAGIPFAFGRFNDGEMGGIMNEGFVAARGDQRVGSDLREALKSALLHKQENYFVGIPCPLCFPKKYDATIDLIGGKDEHVKLAVNLTNRNWKKFTNAIGKHLKYKKVYWVSGEDQRVENLSFKVHETKMFPRKNSWAHYDSIKGYYEEIDEGSIVFLSCGPLANVLVHEWFQKRPDLTILDVGSTFDPFTRGVRWRCHLGWEETGFNKVPRCESCN